LVGLFIEKFILKFGKIIYKDRSYGSLSQFEMGFPCVAIWGILYIEIIISIAKKNKSWYKFFMNYSLIPKKSYIIFLYRKVSSEKIPLITS
jgi:hypothetical protein